jgi:hypothetical protein
MAKYYVMEVAASPDVITTRPARLLQFQVETNLTADATIGLLDGSTEVITHIVTGTTDSFLSPRLGDGDGVVCEKGIQVTLAGTGSRCTVIYELI